MEVSELDKMRYAAGALLYVPAANNAVMEKIIAGKYPALHSVAFCFEDAIADTSLAEASRGVFIKDYIKSCKRLAGEIYAKVEIKKNFTTRLAA